MKKAIKPLPIFNIYKKAIEKFDMMVAIGDIVDNKKYWFQGYSMELKFTRFPDVYIIVVKNDSYKEEIICDEGFTRIFKGTKLKNKHQMFKVMYFIAEEHRLLRLK